MVLGKGSRVMLIGTDGYMPPLGSRGIILSDFDEVGDCDVLFHGHPCPNPPDTSWVAHRSWLLPLDDGDTAMPADAETEMGYGLTTIVIVRDDGAPSGSSISLLAWFENADLRVPSTARTRK
jgi:hypothetical protein